MRLGKRHQAGNGSIGYDSEPIDEMADGKGAPGVGQEISTSMAQVAATAERQTSNYIPEETT